MALRSAFRERRLTEQARAISVSISRGRQRAAFYRCFEISLVMNECDPFEVLAAAAAIVLFELPVEYGARPFQALWALAAFIIAFGLLYFFLPMEFERPQDELGEFIRIDYRESYATLGEGHGSRIGVQTTVAKTSLVEKNRWGLLDAFWFSFLSATYFGTNVLQCANYLPTPTARGLCRQSHGMVAGDVRGAVHPKRLSAWLVCHYLLPVQGILSSSMFISTHAPPGCAIRIGRSKQPLPRTPPPPYPPSGVAAPGPPSPCGWGSSRSLRPIS